MMWSSQASQRRAVRDWRLVPKSGREGPSSHVENLAKKVEADLVLLFDLE